MTRIEANVPFVEPPEWALLERSLIDLMDDAVAPVMERYVHADGSIMWPTREDFTGIDGLDDAYESFHNWPLFYLMGGGDHLLEHSHLAWEGITRQFSRYDTGHGHPMVVKEYEQGYDWMHQGEGYAFFYNLCLADPGKRAQRREGETVRRLLPQRGPGGAQLRSGEEAHQVRPQRIDGPRFPQLRQALHRLPLRPVEAVAPALPRPARHRLGRGPAASRAWRN